MSKKFLLSCTAVAAIVLFGAHTNAQAESLEVSGGEPKEVSNKTYDILHTKDGGKIIGKHLTVIENENTSNNTDIYSVTAEGPNSVIELLDTTIKGINSEISRSLKAKDGGSIKMTGGSISSGSIHFENSKSNQNKLEDVTINSQIYTIESNLILKKVTSKSYYCVRGDHNSQITISGGIFDSEAEAIYSTAGSNITLNDNVTVTSDTFGLWARYDNATITMTGGTVKGGEIALSADSRGYIDVTDITLTTDNKGTGAESSYGTINLQNATIKEAVIGLEANYDGVIQMTGGSITVSETGAFFENSKSDKNKLENVVITSSSNDKPITTGVSADNKSTVALKNITVKNAEKALFANDNSQMTVTGGSFGGEVQAKQGSTITLNDNVTVTSENNGLHAYGEKAKITMAGGTVKGQKSALLTENAGYIDVTDITLTADDKGTGAKSIGPNSMINLHDNTTIKEAAIGLKAENNGVIQMTGGSITVSETGASFENNKNDKNKLENVVITSSSHDSPMSVGVSADKESTVALKNITVKNAEKALFANDNSQMTVTGGSFGGEVQAKQGSTITLNDNVTVTSENDGLHANGEKAKITMTGGNVNAKETAFVVKDGGQIDIKDIASAKAERSGIRFDDTQNDQTSEINLNNTKLLVENGTGIVASSSNGKLNLKDSEIHADTLFIGITHDAPQHDETFTLSAENSLLQGGVKNDENGRTTFDLKNDTTWLITTSTKEKDQNGDLLDIAQRSRSDVSVLNLNDSTIVFDTPTEDHYHTLHIGSGKPDTQAVYNASGDAKISFNVGSVESSDITDQENDRLLIQGDVSGTTIVSVMSDFKDSSNITEAFCPSSNTSGVSLIQVSGKADENSFKLANGYIQETGSPYRYRLTAYGPTSSYGAANETQNLLGENETFWDFRLQKFILPQVASYLALPNALFYAGFIDMAKQSASLANARATAMGIQDNDKMKGFFLSSYGSIATLYSQQYAYNTNIRYAATQAGFTASAQDGQNTTIYWGLTGTYAQLSLSPKDIEDSEKSTLDKWSVTAYSGIEHNS
uniref:autotransporter outer membrane beta-barrel domain-containing protein n=1 Tax=Bartonella doshiae TaxID=33044 RepID=UPI001ABACA47